MKKNILIIFCFLYFCFDNNQLFSQKKIQTNNQSSIEIFGNNKNYISPTSVVIGTTTYDLQTNASMPRRILTYPNGKVSVVWTGSTDIGTTWPDRGTFYNHFNGITWGAAPTTRIESKRVGWGNLSKTNSGEIIVSHVNAVTTNTGVGTAFGVTRNAGEFLGMTWPRTASVNDTVYALISTSASDPVTGFVSPVYFGRSTNGGLSFDTLKANFAVSAGYDTTNHTGDIGADSYSIDAYKNYVAILILGTTEDVILLKSSNYGVTWSKKIIRRFPVHKYVGGILADTVGVTSSGSVVIDKFGVVHVAFCDLKVSDPDGSGLVVDLVTKSNYINYWNDLDTIIRKVNTLVDLNGNGKIDYGRNFTSSGTVRYGNSGLSLDPMLSVSSINPNRVILTYAAVKDGDTTTAGVAFRNIYTMSTTNKGVLWSPITNISQTTGVENMYVSTPREILTDGYLHLTWQQDFYPGNAVQGQHNTGASQIIYDKILIETNPIPNVLRVGFIINKTSQCLTGNSFVFTDTSNVKLGLLVPLDSVILRQWSFGDGTFSILKNPIKSYLNPGTYSIKLKIITANGIADSIIKTVIISPVLNNAVITGNGDFVFANKSYNYSIPHSNGIVYYWAIANGSIVSGQGTNKIVVKWKDGNNIGVVRCNRTLGSCTDFITDTLNVLSNFISNNQEYCGPSRTSIINGNQVSIPNLNYVWIKSITDSINNYTAIVNSNNKDLLPSIHTQTVWYRRVVSFGSYIDTSNAINIKIYARPISIIDTLSNLTQCRIGNSFKFYDNSLLNSGSIVSRIWNFGDNTTSTLINPEKSYSSAGVYQVSLVIESNLGCKDTSILFVNVSQLPTPNYTINRASQCLLYNNFEFVNTSTINVGSIESSYWKFGDGTTASTLNATKTYATAGNYIVKLIVTSNMGCIDSISKSISVLQSPSAGKIAGPYDNLTKNTPYLYNVNQQLNLTYNWEIQNGAIVSGQGTNAVTIQWIDNGIGTLNCILTNSINCVDTAKLSVNIGFLGVQNNTKNKLNIHPNPTNNTIHIEGLSSDMNNSAIIYSIQGKLLKIIPTIENAEIDLSAFNSGVYLIKINDVAHRIVKL